MGSEIGKTRFSRDDFRAFGARLREETELLGRWLREGKVLAEPLRLGAEVEAWLVDARGEPAPVNAEVLRRLPASMAVPELAQFNLELNVRPRRLPGRPFSALEKELTGLTARVDTAGADLGARIAYVGILPSVLPEHLCVERMSRLRRYQALNEQVLQLRNRRPMELYISGDDDEVRLSQPDVMLESAATSLQVHLQVAPEEAARYFNAAVAASAATVAVAANAPGLFGHLLWEETRIPLFEQAVEVAPAHRRSAGPPARVCFGSDYARDGLYGFFVENCRDYPVLLPVLLEESAERLPHLALHNGTIWRWNRPLVGFDARERCHLRVEHRVMSAGPTPRDMTANTAFFVGLAHALATAEEPIERRLPFPVAERNFYTAARHGLAARIRWPPDGEHPLRGLIGEVLLPLARKGLEAAGVAASDIDRYLDVIAARVRTGRTGAAWQRDWIQKHGRDAAALVCSYLARQSEGAPVHEWAI